MGNKFSVIINSCVLFFLIMHGNSLSWDNEVTHKDLSEIAAQNSVLNAQTDNCLKNLGLNKGLKEVFKWNKKQAITDWLREGADLEDAGNLWQSVTKQSRSYNHFHNPTKQYPWTDAGLNDYIAIPNPLPPFIPPYINFNTSGESALLWAQDQANQQSYSESKGLEGDQTWQTIRLYYYNALTGKTDTERQEYFARTFKGLGHQMHLIQDMSVPAHVRNDAHPEDAIQAMLLKKNIPTGDLHFETWAKTHPDKINGFASKPLFPQVDLTKNPGGKVPITQLYDSDQYVEGVAPSTNLSWGLSEYANANFISTDTIFTDTVSKDDPHYFRYPSSLLAG